MKKTLASFAFITLLMGLVLPMFASALGETIPDTCIVRRDVDSLLGTTGCTAGASVGIGTEYVGARGAMCCMFGTILYVVDLVFMIVLIVVVIFILLGAFTLMTASGSAEGVAKGRGYIVMALVGVAVAVMAKALPYIIRTIIGY